MRCAQREHVCDGCEEPIRVGEPYDKSVFIDEDGQFKVEKGHPSLWCLVPRAEVDMAAMAEEGAPW